MEAYEVPRPTAVRFVTAYRVTRHYGGPEEGGWWYDWYAPLESIRLNSPVRSVCRVTEDAWWPVWRYPEPSRLKNAEAQLMARWDGMRHGDIGSVLGGTDVAIYLEPERNFNATKERPRYE